MILPAVGYRTNEPDVKGGDYGELVDADIYGDCHTQTGIFLFFFEGDMGLGDTSGGDAQGNAMSLRSVVE